MIYFQSSGSGLSKNKFDILSNLDETVQVTTFVSADGIMLIANLRVLEFMIFFL